MTKSKGIRLLELVLTVALGFGAALYRFDLAEKYGTALNYGGTNLPMWRLYPVYAVCALLLVGWALFLYKWQDISGQKPGQIFKAVSLMAAAGMMAAGGLLLFENLESLRLMVYAQMAFLLVCGAALAVSIITNGKVATGGIYALFPVYYLCILLFIFYRLNAKNPNSGSFATEIISIIALMLAAYSLAAVIFEKPKPRMQLFLCLAGTYFAAVEVFTFMLSPTLLGSVPGVSGSMVLTFASMGLYAAAGVFQPTKEQPAPKHRAGYEVEGAPILDLEAPAVEELTVEDDDLLLLHQIEVEEEPENTDEKSS